MGRPSWEVWVGLSPTLFNLDLLMLGKTIQDIQEILLSNFAPNCNRKHPTNYPTNTNLSLISWEWYPSQCHHEHPFFSPLIRCYFLGGWHWKGYAEIPIMKWSHLLSPATAPALGIFSPTKNPTSVTFPLPFFGGEKHTKNISFQPLVFSFFVGFRISIHIDAIIFPTSTPEPTPFQNLTPPTPSRKDQIPSSSGAGGPNHVGKLRARDQRLILDHPRKGERFQAERIFIFVFKKVHFPLLC